MRKLCECSALERARSKTLGQRGMELNQIEEVRPSGFVKLNKGAVDVEQHTGIIVGK